MRLPPLQITDEERIELERRVRSSTIEARAARRARIILLAADGVSNRKIAELVGMHFNQVGIWRQRFEVDGVTDSTRAENFVAFLTDLVAQTPTGMQLHCIVDNLSAHGTPAVEAFLDDHPQVFLHRTPTHASWLNQVELWFSIMQRRLIRNGEFDSVDHLADRIIEFINAYNRQAKPFRWTYDARPLKVA